MAACVIAMLITLGLSRVDAQTLQVGTIHGRVTDESGSAMPGVTAVLSSPALLQPVTVIADGAGLYRFEQLASGVYAIKFTLDGFQQFVRENIQISAGFSAEVNVKMLVGQLAETVTVSAMGPVVDTTSSTPSTTVPAAVLRDELPVTRKMQEVVAATPGVMPGGVPDLGGGTISGGSWSAYGLRGSNTSLIEGINTRQSTTAPGDNFNMDALEEFQVIAVGAGAEIGGPGVALVAIMPSGGDQFHGRAEARFQKDTPWLEGNNLSARLIAQGLSAGIAERIKSTVDAGGNLGGPILRGKWWFFGASHVNNSHRSVYGYVNEDGTPANAHTLLTNQTVKSTFQLTPKYKLIGFWDIFTSLYQDRNASALVPKENTLDQTNHPRNWKAQFQGIPTSTLVFDAFIGDHHYLLQQTARPNPSGKPTTFDLTTLRNTGPATAQDKRFRTNVQINGSMAFSPNGDFFGRHQLKAGVHHMIMSQGNNDPNSSTGNMQLIFQNGVPVQIRFYNFPIEDNRTALNETGIYITDTWRIGNNLTLNLGLRADLFDTFLPEQSKGASTYGPPWSTSPPYTGVAASYPRISTGAWNVVAPRIGAVWNVFGDGRTVLRASAGRYNWSPSDDWAANFNQNGAANTTFTWRDLNGNRLYEPGEVDLNPNGPDYVSVAAGSTGGGTALPNTVMNPDLSIAYTNQFVVQLERELAEGLSAKIGYVYAIARDVWAPISHLVPYEAWNRPVQVFDPGPTGTPGVSQGGPAITLFDLDPAFRGEAFSGNKYVNRDTSDTFKTIEFGVTKRSSDRWSVLASQTMTRNHRWIVPIVTNPNQLNFPIDDTWVWQTTVSGHYLMPLDIDVSATYQAYNGLQGQRTATYVSPRVPIPGAGRIVIPVEPFGATSGEMRSLLNIKVAKKLSGLRLFFEVLNTLNNNSSWNQNFNSGPSFGVVSQIPNPRIARLGTSFTW